MSTHASALFIHECQLHATALAHLKAMMHINELRAAKGEQPAYSEEVIARQLSLVDAHVIDPRNYQ